MDAATIIQEISNLEPSEQAKIIRFAYELDAKRQLSGGELTQLAKRLAETTDQTEALLIRETMIQGFYGKRSGA